MCPPPVRVLLASLVLAASGGAACARSRAAKGPEVEPGTYNGRPERYVGLLQLQVGEDGKATFLNVVSAHLPPVELERREVRLEPGPEGRLCMEPAPDSVEKCLTRAGDGALVVVTRPEGHSIRLERVPR
ncbi:hypothetical protein JRI60_52680 [Archangium violaceum]|uniref:hypothetical protein n=1 Tax=Archangium violaceum TaxID=83451 RepID=UPI00194F9495|nr:hypothetical protein [Archangium violaceum]QRN97491.1 hypothetical protein JRI60_52680 [Archangium violaceum]